MAVATIDRSKEWIVKDYLELEEGLLAQLIEGQLVMSPAPAKTILQPDLIYISASKSEIITEQGIEGVPRLLFDLKKIL